MAIFLACLALNAWLSSAGWRNALLDTQGFRQTQTALTSYWMIHDGWKLDYITPVMGAPWSIPLEFPFYQAAAAAVCKTTGMPLDSAGRLVALAFFYASLPAIWLLLRRLAVTPAHRWLFLALLLTCPVYVFFSRAFLIESSAFCVAAWFLYFFHVALEPRRWTALVLALSFGVLAGLAKVTTFAVVLLPAAVLLIQALNRNRPQWRRLILSGAFTVGPGLAASAWWVHHTDAVKRLNVLGTSLTSTGQRTWVFGTLAQRLDPASWRQLAALVEHALVPLSSLVLIAALFLLFRRGVGRAAALLLGFSLAGPLIFSNLYFNHDYYLYPVGVFVLALIALPLRNLMVAPQVPLPARLGVVLLVLGTQVGGYLNAYYGPQRLAAPAIPELARAIALTTPENDVILGLGLNWNPVLPYYSGRRGLFVPDVYLHDTTRIEQALKNLGTARVAAVVIYRYVDKGPEQFKPWLEKLGMDETPLFATGEFHVHLRKDLMLAAMQATATAGLKDIYLYNGQLQKPGEQPRVLYEVNQLKDRSMLAAIHPMPSRITTPFGLGAIPLNGGMVLGAHASTDIEIPLPAGARHISADFGINPAAYTATDGVEFQIMHVFPSGGQELLYHRWLQPGLLDTDRGLQTLKLETAAPLEGSLIFQTLPGPAHNANSDWSYWARIDVK